MGEGTFGKVYLMGLSGPDMPVLKMVPVGGDIKVNDGNQAGLTEMLSEVVISNTLSILCNGAANCTQGFVNSLYEAEEEGRVVQPRPPSLTLL